MLPKARSEEDSEEGMVRSDLVDNLTKHNPNLPKQDINLVVATILECMIRALGNQQRIEIRGFGTFSLQYRSPRTARNPSSGLAVQVPERHTPHFRAGKDLRHAIQASYQPSPKDNTRPEERSK